MIPIDIQVSRSKVKVKGQAYSSYVGEGGHLCFTNSYILVCHATQSDEHKLDIELKQFYYILLAAYLIYNIMTDNQKTMTENKFS